MVKSSSLWFMIRPKKVEYIVCEDISNGREHHKIPAFSYKESDTPPSDYHYVTDHVQKKLVAWIDTSLNAHYGCKCEGDCSDGRCACSEHGSKSNRYYNYEGRLSSQFNIDGPDVIYECNSSCKCNAKSCINTVIQRGSKCRLALIRTKSRGWGIRTLEDIKKGSFVGVYSGELIALADSSVRPDDTYLFNLNSSSRRIKKTNKQQQAESMSLSDDKTRDNQGDHDQQQSQTKKNQRQEADFFLCDAKKYGNFTRFINHSCEPNVVAIRAFTTHYDQRFPHIAFFANQFIPANTELSLHYGDNYWLVKCRRDSIYCLCKSSKCRFNKRTFPETLRQSRDKEQIQ